MLVSTPYNKEYFNCATTVCEYLRQNNLVDIPDGNLEEYTLNGLLWIKKYFVKTNCVEKHNLLLVKNIDGTLHVAVYDGDKVIHACESVGQVVKEPLWNFINHYRNIKIFKLKDKYANTKNC